MTRPPQDQEFPHGFINGEGLEAAGGDTAAPRLSTCAILYLCRNGTGVFSAPDAELDIAPGDILFMAPGQAHSLRCVSDEPCTCLGMDFVEHSFAEQLLGDHDLRVVIEHLKGLAFAGQHRLHLSATTTTAIERHLLRLSQHCQRAFRGRNAVLKTEAAFILTAIMLDPSVHPHLEAEMPTTTRLGRIHTVLNHIQQHFRDKLTVTDMAALAGLSRSHFHNAFRRTTGCSLIEYLNHYRVMRAKKDILRSNRPLADIAREHGFSSPCRFSIVYRQIWQCTPRESRQAYRAAHRKDSFDEYDEQRDPPL